MEETLKGLLGENIELRLSVKKVYKDKKHNRIFKNSYIQFDSLSQDDIDYIIQGEFDDVNWTDESYREVNIGSAKLLKIDAIYRVDYLIGEREHDGGVVKVTLKDLTLVWDKRVNSSNQWIQIRCNGDEKQRWQKSAEENSCPQLSTWIKQLLNREVEKTLK